MENDIIDSLNDIKYSGKLTNPQHLQQAVEGGSKSVEYTELVSFLSKELKQLCKLEEEVNAITSADDSSAFLMELSSFLKEMGCPYDSLTTGHLSDRLNSKNEKLLLLDYLLSELMAVRMIKATRPNEDEDEMSLKLHESETARHLKNLLLALQFNKPPANITPAQLFQKVESKVREVCKRAGTQLLGKPAFTGHLSEKQWNALSDIQKNMQEEYTIRREMLIKRLDVTIQSFQWSDRLKSKSDQIETVFKKRSALMKKSPDVDLSDLLAARDDITIIEKTSSASVRKNTQTSVNKVIIGQVPDRGGRPNEQEPPPPEMPSWQQRSTGGGVGRGGGNQGGFGRGGNQGGFSRGGNQGGFGSRGGGNQGYSGGNQSYGGGNQSYSGGSQGYGGGNQSYGGGSQNSGSGNQNYGGANQRDNRGNQSYGSGYGDNRGGYGGSNRNQNSYSGGYQQGAGMTYADQYVQDSSRNQDYRGGSGNYHRDNRNDRGGRSNYNRGGYR